MPESSTHRPPPIRLRAPSDLIAVIPVLLGFHPEESLVLLCLGGPRSQVQMTLRVDLRDLREPGAVGGLVARAAAQAEVERIVGVVFTARTRRTNLPHRRLADRIAAACVVHGVQPLDLLLVSRGRWWSYDCPGEACCPPDGRPVATEPTAELLRLQAETVVQGGRVWPSRRALEASVRAPRGAAATTFRRAVAAVGRPPSRDDTVALLRELHVRYRDGGTRIEVEDAARIAVGLQSVQTRDAVLTWGGGAQPGVLCALLADLVRLCAPPYDAAAAATLAWSAYLVGDGALARCALERALATDATYSLALLLEDALDRAVPPSALSGVTALLRELDDADPL